MNKRLLPIMLILIGAACYGLLSPFVKLAYTDGWTNREISSSQMTMSALLVWLLVLVTPSAWSNPFRGPWIRLLLNGLIGISLTTLFINAALQEMDASLSVVLLFQFTWITIVIDSISKKKRPTRNQTLAVIVILLGTVFAVNVFEVDFSTLSLMGLVYGLASSLTYSLFLFGTGRIETTMHPLMRSAVMLTGALPAVYVLFPPTHFLDQGMGGVLLWGLFLGFLGQVAPTLCFNVGIPKVGSTLAALLGSAELPVATVGAFLIAGENVSAVQWIGILIIIFGIFLSEIKVKTRYNKVV